MDFDYARISTNYPVPNSGARQVKTGDALRSIAQRAYSDSSLWYRFAEVNGLGSLALDWYSRVGIGQCRR